MLQSSRGEWTHCFSSLVIFIRAHFASAYIFCPVLIYARSSASTASVLRTPSSIFGACALEQDGPTCNYREECSTPPPSRCGEMIGINPSFSTALFCVRFQPLPFFFAIFRPGRHGHVRIRYPHVLVDTPASSPLSLTQDLISNLQRRAVLTTSSFDRLVSLIHRLSSFPCSLAPLSISFPLSTLPLRSTSMFIDLVALLPTTNIGTWSVVYMTYLIVVTTRMELDQ